MMQLAQSLPIDPVAIGDQLGKAQDVQTVLGIVIGLLLLAVVSGIVFHIREARRWEAKYEKRLTKNEKTWNQVRDAIHALAGLPVEEDTA